MKTLDSIIVYLSLCLRLLIHYLNLDRRYIFKFGNLDVFKEIFFSICMTCELSLISKVDFFENWYVILVALVLCWNIAWTLYGLCTICMKSSYIILLDLWSNLVNNRIAHVMLFGLMNASNLFLGPMTCWQTISW